MLLCENLKGGDICISTIEVMKDTTKFYDIPVSVKFSPVQKMPAVEGKIYQFEGSRWYHWTSEIEEGRRVSLTLNFWDVNNEE